ncbi:DUF3828 domain-containing protein [Methylobacterium nodulans]|uniref:DUF3828 domain-containing protein n=1 Tax=Methylobacterium nodulans (strain LMG 21967 / CNCM I-2342 / ORS 2060) TaxID=460265 RepID=B8ICP0_METNO|nr:DUF3828 domain-containing protein [Methylobacterium nodulans]ACL57451.1 conserved hypothetical protein [Methylobacterium nodulans ORS 2060]
MAALMRLLLFVFATGIISFEVSTAVQAQFATPEAAVQAVYAQYQGSSKRPNLLSLRLDSAAANHFFEPELARAWLKDLASASNGDNVIDVDPFIGAQDANVSKLSIERSKMMGEYAVVQANLRNFSKPTHVTYRLKRAPDGWRIYDVTSNQAQGLRRMLGLRD